jgi:hypothetical protein
MKPSPHILLGLVPSFFLFLLGFNFLEISIFFSSSFFFIDLDHVPRFIFKYKSINPVRFYKEHTSVKNKWMNLLRKEQEKYKKPIFFFHNVETLIVLIIISYFYSIILLIFYGFLFHLICDFIYQHYHKQEKHYKISLIYTLVKNKNKIIFKETC